MTAPASTTRQLSMRDEAKPFVLIGVVGSGLIINRLADGALTHLDWLVQIGLFAVVFSIMAFVEINGVGRAFHKTRPTALAVATNFVIVPLFAWTLGWLILRDHPDLWAGVILYTLTPCIGWYLIFIDLAKGNMDWGPAMLPIDITLQTLLLPVYLWLLIGKVIPIEPLVLLRSVTLFFIGLFATVLAVERIFELTYADTATMVFEVSARNSEAVIGVAAVAFVGHPLVMLAILGTHSPGFSPSVPPRPPCADTAQRS